MRSMRSFPRTSYWGCKRAIKRLTDFRDLLLYYCSYAGYEERASKPLSEYIDEKLPTYERTKKIEEKISNLIELVGADLRRFGISTIIIRGSAEEKKNIDIILNIFAYLSSDRGAAKPYY